MAAIDRSWAEDGLVGATLTRLQVWPVAFVLILVLQGLIVMALFCVGVVAGRRRWLADPDAHRDRLERVRIWGLLLGLPPSLVGAALVVFPMDAGGDGLGFAVGLVLIYLTAPVASAGYIATVALLPRRGLVKVLETDGTMSLTLYLGESLVMTVLAAGWGFGLFGLDTGPALLVAVAVWVGLSAGAWLWHRRFRTGPAETALRRLTYAGLARQNAGAG